MFNRIFSHARRSFDIFVGFVCLAVASAGMVRGLAGAFVMFIKVFMIFTKSCSFQPFKREKAVRRKSPLHSTQVFARRLSSLPPQLSESLGPGSRGGH